MRKPPLQDVIVMSQADRLRERPAVNAHPTGQPRSASSDIQRPAYVPPRGTRPLGVHHEGGERHSYNNAQDTYDERPRVHPPVTSHNTVDEQYEEEGSSKKWLILSLFVGAVVVGTAFVLSMVFAGASVTIYPKQDTIVANAQFTAREDGADGALAYRRIMLERTAVQNVPALKEEMVEERAQGTITIYNEYSESPQRLIKQTRFKAEDGKIYRIRESVEVPGKQRNGQPGTIEVTVFAEEPGEAYNRGASSFSIPGYAGAPQEGKIYAKSESEMTGGFAGVKPVVDEADRVKARESLESQLRAELLTEVQQTKDIPEGYRAYKEAVFFEFNLLPDESVEDGQVQVTLTGKLYALLFEDDALARNVAKETIGSYQGSPIRIDNIGELTVSVQAKAQEGDAAAQAETPWNASVYDVAVAGKARFIWEFDEVQLAKDMAGKERTVFDVQPDQGLRADYPGIDRVQSTIRPFWKQSFPEDPQLIKVEVKLDE